MSAGVVFDIRKFSVHDGPGIRTAVFLKGCPLRCAWCHNPEGLSPEPALLFRAERCVDCGACARACPEGRDPREAAARGPAGCAAAGRGLAARADDSASAGGAASVGGPSCEGPCAEACPAEALQAVGRRMDVDEVMARVIEDLPFYEESGGGATFSGGEPLLQAEFLGELLDACRAAGVRSAVDTSGWASRDTMRDIARRADLLLFDLKVLDPAHHLELTGAALGPVLGNLRAIASMADSERPEVELRVPLVPGVNDGPEELRAIADFARGLGTGWPLRVLPYHDAARGKYRLWRIPYPLGDLAVPGADEVAAARELLEEAGISVRIGG